MEGLAMLKQLIGQLQQLLDSHHHSSSSSSVLQQQSSHQTIFLQHHPPRWTSFDLEDSSVDDCCGLVMAAGKSHSFRMSEPLKPPPAKKPRRDRSRGKSSGRSSTSEVMEQEIWKDFPEDLFEAVIARLPIAAFFRFRSVCRQWNSLLASQSFSKQCAEVPQENPWFYTITHENVNSGAMYDPSLKKWHHPSISPLPTKLIVLPVASAGGLVCFLDIGHRNFYVCNPLTQSFKELPARSVKVWSRVAVGMTVNGNSIGSGYKILWVGCDGEYEVYDSVKNSWSRPGNMPGSMNLPLSLNFRSQTVSIDSTLYFMRSDPEGVVSYDMATGVWKQYIIPAPLHLTDHTLAEYDGQIMLVGLLTKNAATCVCIWELQRMTLLWKEVDFGRAAASCSEIVRFSNEQDWEIGRIPNEWARCLLPLVRDNKVRVEGKCEFAPNVLGIMDSINLSISVFINRSMFVKHHQVSLKDATNSTDESVFHPLPALFRLLGLSPFKKAELTPGDFYSNKRPFSQTATLLHAKSEHPSQNGNENEDEDSVSEFDLDNIVGVASSSELEEMDPPGNLLCELRPYQKQALHWMVQMEKGRARDETATTLHPCWEAYRLADKRELVVYLNAFSGEATTEFPSTLQMARGGILADAMGLGKTIMTISLLVAHSGKGGSLGSQPIAQSFIEGGEVSDTDTIPNLSKVPKKTTKFTGFDKSTKKNTSLTSGGNLIICPMTLLGQWKAEIETHVHPGTLSLYVHYGQGRPKDAKSLAQCDVVITTFGILASDFSSENGENNGGLFSIRWFRVVLDEAHTIKSSKSQVSMAASALIADNRWCLTGTPIQNNLEDVYSLLRFLRIEPWGHWAWWNKLIQKPFEGGDERGLKLVQSILKPIMLRRTKHSTDREGKPILVLPPADMQIIYCEPTEAEKDFYEALFKRSKVKFDQFVEQGRVLHNYASILELLLRLRQCCDHPFLVMSRGDTQEFADLNKLAKRFLRGTCNASEGEVKDALSRAYVQEVVEELRKGEQGECPICLEAFEDSVLTPCAHRLCRECLLASWRNSTSGLCPVCRKTVSKQDLITAPTESRFQIDIEKNWVESCKVTGLMNELENLRSSGSKSIVFSQWTAFLDLLQIPFTRNKISFVRLDGTLNLQQREKVIKQFSEDSDIQVLLMSLKAGGVGINLTAASNAFVMDPWWNPAVEEQAVMRIHRIGQTKKVAIKRFIVKGSVEQRMEAVQARKQRMISGALTDQEVRSARIEELKMLFT